ncbi:MAG: 4-hydroxy-tetrahydrodipicolinate reductase [Bacteroidia bacterium]|jgi:4-hydroxy-tetrahydrodipicolinate reductase
MGKEIEAISVERHHEIVLKVGRKGTSKAELNASQAQVAIEFSTPSTALQNISACAQAQIPVIVGTTAWYDHYERATHEITRHNSAMLCATNFSIGVNLFFKLTEQMAQLMNGFTAYEPSIEEIHHLQKLDAPSGTAITTAERLLLNFDRKKQWVHLENGKDDNKSAGNPLNLNIASFRQPDVPGTHTVSFNSEIDTLSLSHVAHSRKGFAWGAIMAAEWILDKKGIFSMQDVLKF